MAGADAPVQVGELQVRPVSFASLLMLRKLGNPMATAIESGATFDASNMEAILEFLWVQCAPWESVRKLCAAMRPGGDRAVLEAQLLDFAATLTPQTVQAALQEITRQQEQVRAAAASVIPDATHRSDSKN